MPNLEVMRRLTALWLRAQPSVQVFLSATVRHTADAEDLLQEVAQTVAENFAEFDESRPFTAWAMGIARNKVGNYLKKQSRSACVFDSDLLDQLASAQATLKDDDDERRQALTKCLDHLAGRQRQAVQMRYVRDMKPGEIAVHLGMTRNAMFVFLHRIRTALARCIEQRLASGSERP